MFFEYGGIWWNMVDFYNKHNDWRWWDFISQDWSAVYDYLTFYP